MRTLSETASSETVTEIRVKSSARRLRRVALAGLAAFVAFGFVAPRINAARFSGPIKQTLESSLGRSVTFAKVHFTLFSGPGFYLEDVVIGEDPRFGVEPFAYVPTLDARLRIDKLLLGQIRFSSLRLVEPSLNLVKQTDGTWNVVALGERLSAPRRVPLNFFPAFEVTDGRIDFKFGTRKATLYILDADLAVYPQRSGKLYVQFSGSPARTDRARNGFGHLRGSANWYLNASSPTGNQLEADVTLDPSNLSEITTLFEGHDLGVHGTVSSHARIDGPATALRILGDMHVEDVHRWDLLPSSGEQWRIAYRGNVDLSAHRLEIETLPAHRGELNPLSLEMHVNSFLTRPAWSVLAQFHNTAVQDLLPLSRRMGLSLPQQLRVDGAVEGFIGYSSGLGLAGRLTIHDARASSPGAPEVHAGVVNATVSSDRVHLDPTSIDIEGGTLQAGGDYYLAKSRVVASLATEHFSTDAFKDTINAWFGMPFAVGMFSGGTMFGELLFTQEASDRPLWSGQFRVTDADSSVPGIAVPLKHSQGRVTFDDLNFDLERFSATLGKRVLHGSYRYSALTTPREHLHLELPAADLSDIESALDPTLKAQGLLARLRLSRRAIPQWLAARNLEGDLSISEFSVNRTILGPLLTRFTWQGENLQFTRLQVNLPEGLVRARGSMNMASYSPRYRFNANVTGFPWGGGLLSAEGTLDTSGTGVDSLRHLRANGTFSGDNLNLTTDDTFSRVSGAFAFSFAEGWPNLRLSGLQASDGDEEWTGEAMSQSDGKLIFDLEHAGRQRRVISSLLPENSAAISSLRLRMAKPLPKRQIEVARETYSK